ncbi:MAG TPA: TatD family hydrolase [Phycisphaerae bacterium]|nr:TatD family hydrolase [Phycisphaerae bacterium]HNU43691.1 TatD family hydrolase [Phycisphaerae bacterium]
MTVTLIDSHAHLTDAGLAGQVEDVLERARRAGVERVISIGLSAADALAAVALAERFGQQVRATAGIHPHEAAKAAEADFEQVRRMLDDLRVVALGEVGLDYHYDFAPRDVQRAVFARQLAWLQELDRPVVVHCREAWDDTVALLREHGLSGRPVVFHCFSGSAEQYAVLQDEGWWASFTGVVTFRRAVETQQIARSCPPDQLMIETDAPYLSPEPVRSRRTNEPAYLVHIARFLADLRGTDYEALAAQMTANTERFFRI